MKNNISGILFITLLIFASCKKTTDNNGNSSTPKPTPVANFTYTGNNANAPATVTFINTSQNATSYSWDFGDGNTSGSESPTHLYTVGGSYSVRLTAAGDGGTNSITKVVTVMNTAIDTIPPVITLSGSSTMTISLNSTFTDPGATANDNKDGNTSVSVSGTVDKDTKGTYTLTYSSTDLAGNTGTATRTIIVVNDAEKYVGNYLVTESSFSWMETITTDVHVNNRIHFTDFSDYINNNQIYATAVATFVDIAAQTAIGIGTNGCTHTFSPNGSGNPIQQIAGKYSFSIKYTDQEIYTSASCTGTTAIPYEDFFVQQ